MSQFNNMLQQHYLMLVQTCQSYHKHSLTTHHNNQNTNLEYMYSDIHLPMALTEDQKGIVTSPSS